MKSAGSANPLFLVNGGGRGCSRLVPPLEFVGCRWMGGSKAVVAPLLESSWKTERTKEICTVK